MSTDAVTKKRTRRGKKNKDLSNVSSGGSAPPYYPNDREALDSEGMEQSQIMLTEAPSKKPTRRGRKSKHEMDSGKGWATTPYQSDREIKNAPNDSYHDGMQSTSSSAQDTNAPFGYLEPQDKAYLYNMEKLLYTSSHATSPALENDGTNASHVFGNENALDPEDSQNLADASLAVANLHRFILTKELLVATDPGTSRILERLLRKSTVGQLVHIGYTLAPQWGVLMRHPFASHVVQTLTYLLACWINELFEKEKNTALNEKDGENSENANGEDDLMMEHWVRPRPVDPAWLEEESDQNNLVSSHVTLGTVTCLYLHLLNPTSAAWADLLFDPYATHILRFHLSFLSGGDVEQARKIDRSRKSKNYNARHENDWTFTPPAVSDAASRAVGGGKRSERKPSGILKCPEALKQKLQVLVHGLTSTWTRDQIREWTMHPVANPVLQILLPLSSSGSILYTALTSTSPSTSTISIHPTLTTHTIASHFLQILLPALTPEAFKEFYQVNLRGKLFELSQDRVGVFVAQTLVETAGGKMGGGAAMGVVLDEILGEMDADCKTKDDNAKMRLVCVQRSGLVLAMIRSVKQYPELHKRVMKAVFDDLGTHTPDERKIAAYLIMTMMSHEDYKNNLVYAPAVNLNGALIVQELLQFPRAVSKIFADGIASMEENLLLGWMKDPIASRTVECLLVHYHKSQASNEESTLSKAKKKLISLITTHITSLACDKSGSHLTETAFAVACAAPALRVNMLEALVAGEKEILGSFCGRFVWRSCGVEAFKREVKRHSRQGVSGGMSDSRDAADEDKSKGSVEVWMDKKKKKVKVSRAIAAALQLDSPSTSSSSAKGAAHSAKSSSQLHISGASTQSDASFMEEGGKSDPILSSLLGPSTLSIVRKAGPASKRLHGRDGMSIQFLETTPEGLTLNSDETNLNDLERVDEVDELFKKRKRGGKNVANPSSSALPNLLGENEGVATENGSGETKHTDKTMQSVLDALAGTKKKKKKQSGTDDCGAKPKRKFES